MFELFRRSRNARPAAAPARRPRRLELEALESREVPTIGLTDLPLNTATAPRPTQAVSPSSKNGMSVAVWTHQFSSTDTDIRAQLYNPNGTRRGGEIRVAS